MDFSSIVPKVSIDKIVTLAEIAMITVLLIILVNFTFMFIKRRLLKRAKNKSQISRIKIFVRMSNISFVFVIIVFAFLTYFKSWTGIGVVAGLLTAAIGFALQRPITGIAAWIMVAVNHPFRVGDRITIGQVKGDAYDISLTHVFIDEVGGGIETEQHSGRNVMVPNYKLFEEVLINHTLIHDFVLDEVAFTVRYDSDLDAAMAIAEKSANEIAGEHGKKISKPVTVRIAMVDSGIKVRVLFFAPVQDIARVKSEITKKIYEAMIKEKLVGFAYNRLDISVKK